MDMSEAAVNALNRKMDRVLDILENDDRTGEKGLVTQFGDLRQEFHAFLRQYNIDQAVKRGKDIVWRIVWGAVGGGVLAALWAFIKFLGTLIFKAGV